MWVVFLQVLASDAEMTGVIITAYIFNVFYSNDGCTILAAAML